MSKDENITTINASELDWGRITVTDKEINGGKIAGGSISLDKINFNSEPVLQIKVKYFNPRMTELQAIKGEEHSNWIDVRARDVEVTRGYFFGLFKKVIKMDGGKIKYRKGDDVKVYLGFAMELPQGWEAYILPRSGTYKNYGLMLVNSEGVVDTKYCGDNDEWMASFRAFKKGVINFDERVGQFRVQRVMPKLKLVEVDKLGNEDRGGFGSTGVK